MGIPRLKKPLPPNATPPSTAFTPASWNMRSPISDRASSIPRARFRNPKAARRCLAQLVRKRRKPPCVTEEESFESSAREWGYRIGGQIYDAYLAGKIAPGGLRRLFLAHLDEPGLARKVCATVISKLRSIARPQARAANA